MHQTINVNEESTIYKQNTEILTKRPALLTRDFHTPPLNNDVYVVGDESISKNIIYALRLK
jgi:hypothetical protein